MAETQSHNSQQTIAEPRSPGVERNSADVYRNRAWQSLSVKLLTSGILNYLGPIASAVRNIHPSRWFLSPIAAMYLDLRNEMEDYLPAGNSHSHTSSVGSDNDIRPIFEERARILRLAKTKGLSGRVQKLEAVG